MEINQKLVEYLIASQFPMYKKETVTPVVPGGHDHRTYHLGQNMSVRLPSHERYQMQVVKEYHWLNILGNQLNMPISKPLYLGVPCEAFPMHFAIYQWLEGTPIYEPLDSMSMAYGISCFLKSFHALDCSNGPIPSEDNFYRGGSLLIYDQETRKEIMSALGFVNYDVLLKIWEDALSSSWSNPPVWVHGDLVGTNLLQKDWELVGVIDFGGLAIGDPACDLTIAWTLLEGASRSWFIEDMNMDQQTWQRAKGWAVWKGLLVYHHETDLIKKQLAKKVLETLIEEETRKINI